MNKRIFLLTALLSVSYAAISWINYGRDESAAPSVDLSTIALKIDDWVGEDIEIKDETVQVLKAESFVNRVYRDSAGREISLHVANWTNSDTIAAVPHHPEICYPGAGWSVLDRRTTEFATSAGKFPIELMQFQKGSQRVVSAHWFRTGSVTYVNDKGFQNQRKQFWGTKGWPNTTKFLIQYSAPSLDSAEETIKEFAAKVVDTFELQGKSELTSTQ